MREEEREREDQGDKMPLPQSTTTRSSVSRTRGLAAAGSNGMGGSKNSSSSDDSVGGGSIAERIAALNAHKGMILARDVSLSLSFSCIVSSRCCSLAFVCLLSRHFFALLTRSLGQRQTSSFVQGSICGK